MPNAVNGSAIYRPDLGQAVMEYYEGDTMGFIGLEVMPLYPVSKQAGSYPVIPKEALLKLSDVDRAPRGTYARDDWEYERGTYSTAEKGYEEPLDDVERELFDQEAPGMAELVATQRAWMKIMRRQEKRIADTIFNTTNFATESVSSEWNNHSTATPVDDVKDGIISFRNSCGMLPDALIVSYRTKEDLIRCTQIQDLIKYTFPMISWQNVGEPELARAMGVPRILVGGAVYDSAGKGISASISGLWSSEYAALVKINNTRDLTMPCVGRTFLWTEDSPQNPIVEEYREENRRSDIYRVRHHVSEELIKSVNSSGTTVSNIADACCYLMDNIHS